MYVPRDSIRNAALDRKLQLVTIFWKCKKCTNIQQNLTSESTNRVLPGPTNLLPSQPVPSTLQKKLKIYQWNADGIRPKLLELRDCLLNSDIDILAVQESKLRKTDKTPSIKGSPQ